MKIRCRTILPFLLLVQALIFSFTIAAQQDFSIQYKDSVELEDASREWISNDVIITNHQDKALKLSIAIQLPQYWQMAGKANQLLTIPAGQKLVFPINIIRSLKALASWQEAKIIFLNTDNNRIDTALFYLKSKAISLFLLEADEIEFTLDKEKKNLDIKVTVKNKGNVEELISINAKNLFFELNNTFSKKLQPGEEYTHTIPLRISNAILKTLDREELRVSVRNKELKTKTINLIINNDRSLVKANPSAYPIIPLVAEAGMFRNSGYSTFYVGAAGYIPLRGDKKINFSYRSRQLGIANTLEQNTFSLEYRTKNWRLYAGQLSDITSFFSFGQGVSVTYYSPKKAETNISAIFHYKANPYKNDVFSWSTKHKVGKLDLKQGIAVNSVPQDGMFAMIATNEIGLIKTKNLVLTADLNVGQNHYNFKLPVAAKERAGLAAGYTLNYEHKSFTLSSLLFKAGRNYPGNYAGIETQNHSLSFMLFNKLAVNPYYSYSSSNAATIFFRDTVFNSNFFDFDFEQYGIINTIKVGKATDLRFGGGQYRQRGNNLRAQLPKAQFFEVGATHIKGNIFRMSFTTNNGFNNSYGPKEEKIWISRTNFSVRYKIAGINAFYFRAPAVQGGGFGGIMDSTKVVRETMNISPYINVMLFRRLNLGLNYNFFRSLYDKSLATSASVNLSYSNKRTGLELIFMGAIPVSNTSNNFESLANNGMQLTVRKSLNIPAPFKRKHYDLDIYLFEDMNLNGVMDESEGRLKNVVLTIAGRRFITDNRGMVGYKNIEKKVYFVDLSTVLAPRGFIPSGGTVQFANVERDTKIYYAYHRGKVISGKIKITLDSLSEKSFTAEKIKVMAIDTAGNYYKTLANDKGEYYINVPPGKYKVTLNPEAFSKDLKPVNMFFWVETRESEEEETVNFEITENKRKIRFLKKE